MQTPPTGGGAIRSFESMYTSFAEWVHKHPTPAVIVFLITVVSLPLGVLGVWLSLSEDIRPQVASVDDPNSAKTQADVDQTRNEINARLNTIVAELPNPAASVNSPPAAKPSNPLSSLAALPPIQPSVMTAPVIRPRPSPPSTMPERKPVVMSIPIYHPKLSPPVHPEFTREIPIVVESTWSNDDSTIAASSLHDALKGDDYTVIDNNSVVPIFIKVEGIDKPPCSTDLSCGLSIHVIGEYADGKIFFTQAFIGYEPETSLVENGYGEARDEAVSKAYNFILSITKN